MSGQGTVQIDFGAFPGKTDATVTITGQSLISGSALAEAWVFPKATADHSDDEHWLDPPHVFAGNVVAGVGFTIYARGSACDASRDTVNHGRGPGRINRSGNTNKCWGKWTIAWVWNG